MSTPCILSPYAQLADGHAQIRINGKATGHHRVVYAANQGVPLATLADVVIRHTCDIPNCVNPAHLVAGTNTANVADRVARDRSAKGVSHGAVKLTEADVLQIRARRFDSSRDLAMEFGVSHTQILAIKNRTKWSHV